MNNKILISLAIFVVWVAVTLFGPKVQLGGGEHPLDELVSHGIGWWFVAAILVMIIPIAILNWWRQTGLRGAEPASSWKLIWFPVVLIALLFSVAALSGLPPTSVFLFVLLNTLLVGISEELATRGILLYGFLTKYGVWVSIVIVSVIFGAMHILNGFNTGDF